MFAVPGWSVSADSLAAEKAAPAKASADAKSRKRKRAGGSADVSASNVADLYESVVEGRKKAPQKKASKRSDGGAKRERKPAGAEAKATKSERQHAGKKAAEESTSAQGQRDGHAASSSSACGGGEAHAAPGLDAGEARVGALPPPE
ncbi:hypothetical protein CDD83_1116 [Cordyceps sp. RAO-2017]|nr:hypothetical protein CDD83_1116 [Cordyceps sp. RAO-2017]